MHLPQRLGTPCIWIVVHSLFPPYWNFCGCCIGPAGGEPELVPILPTPLPGTRSRLSRQRLLLREAIQSVPHGCPVGLPLRNIAVHLLSLEPQLTRESAMSKRPMSHLCMSRRHCMRCMFRQQRSGIRTRWWRSNRHRCGWNRMSHLCTSRRHCMRCMFRQQRSGIRTRW